MVFLGISIEGIACYRPIEVLEKRGLPSQVKWAGGAAAGASYPAPLFGLNFNFPGPEQFAEGSRLHKYIPGLCQREK